jgi:4-hydroxy-2-oxoheptanedioate aldolase
MKNLAHALGSGELLIGPFSVSSSPTLVEMIGYAGFDFVVIDCQHASASATGGELEHLVRAAHAAGVAAIVRTTGHARGEILKALDVGAAAVVVPHVSTREEAAAAVDAAFYAPLGRRSATPSVRATRYGFDRWTEHHQRSLGDTLVIPLIEDEAGVANIDEIAAVPNLGGIFFGPFDLAVAAGRPDAAFEGIEAAREAVYAAARRNALPIADLAWDVDAARDMIEAGAQLIALGTDVAMFAASCQAVTAGVTAMKDTIQAGKQPTEARHQWRRP